MKFDKIKNSPHQSENIAHKIPGHNYSEEQAQAVIRVPIRTEVQSDGRLRHFGWIEEKLVRVVVSAATSAASCIGRVVTAHRS